MARELVANEVVCTQMICDFVDNDVSGQKCLNFPNQFAVIESNSPLSSRNLPCCETQQRS